MHSRRRFGRSWFQSFLVVCAVAGAGQLSTGLAFGAKIYPGPAYDPVNETGYLAGNLPYDPGHSVAGNIAVGNTEKYEDGNWLGQPAVRWDGSGNPPVELANLDGYGTGFTIMEVYAVNAAGMAVGSVETFDVDWNSVGSRGVRWLTDGTAVELGHLGLDSSGWTRVEVFAINASGAAVGRVRGMDGSGNDIGTKAVRWDANTSTATALDDFGVPSGGNASNTAITINDSGTVGGFVTKFDGSGNNIGNRPVRWDAGGTALTELDTFAPSATGRSIGFVEFLDAAGNAYGNSWLHDSNGASLGPRPVRWDAGGTALTELESIGSSAEITDVSSTGIVVGYADKGDGSLGRRALRWDAGATTPTELGILGTNLNGFTDARASGVNAAGIAVGLSRKYDDDGNRLFDAAVMWGLDGVAIDLNTFLPAGTGWINLAQAVGISDDGWITGIGWFDPDGPGGADFYERLFLMRLVPEPSMLSLLALAVAGLAGRRSIRRRGPAGAVR